jgi:hypothetical protein
MTIRKYASCLAGISVAAWCAGCAKPGAAPRSAGEPALVRPGVPAELAVPDDHKLAVVASARGVQIYECATDASGAPAWKLHAPRADLFDASGAQIGIHYGGVDKGLPPGPYWEAKDGSRVHGQSPVSAPNPGSIPLLRLQAADATGTGVLSRVSYVHRLATTGGVAPAEACTAGQSTEVAYTAQYYFYTAP